MAEEKSFESQTPKSEAMPDLVGTYAVENFKAGLNRAESVFEALVRAGALNAAVIANGTAHGRANPWAVDPEKRGRAGAEIITSSLKDRRGQDRRKHCLKLIADTAVLALGYLNIPQEAAFTLPYGDDIAQIKS